MSGRLFAPGIGGHLPFSPEEDEDLPPHLRALTHTIVESSKRKEAATEIRRAFIEKYRLNLRGFITDCIAWDPADPRDYPTPYQLAAADEFMITRRLVLIGPHGLGKSAFASWVVHWFSLTRDNADQYGFEGDWKIVTTAGAWKQLINYLWPEIRTKWVRRLRWDLIGRQPWEPGNELLDRGIKGKTGLALAGASSDAQLIEGAHANSILYLFDESKAVPTETFDAAEGAMSTGGDGEAGAGEAFMIAFSTPGPEIGRFWEIVTDRERFSHWGVKQVTLEETIAAGRNTRKWADDMARAWGVTNPIYINRVLGKFAKNRSDGVILGSWVEAAMDRWDPAGVIVNPVSDATAQPHGPLTHLGVDPADSGADDTCIAHRHLLWVAALEYFRTDIGLEPGEEDPGVMAIADHVNALLLSVPGKVPIGVDSIGVGAGVLSRLRQQHRRAIGIKASKSAPFRTDLTGELEFINLRSWMWWLMRSLLDPANGNKLALPKDPRLLGDLTAPSWHEAAGGRIAVESKDELRKPTRLGRSTDAGDAVIMAFAVEYFATSTIAGAVARPLKKESRWSDVPVRKPGRPRVEHTGESHGGRRDRPKRQPWHAA